MFKFIGLCRPSVLETGQEVAFLIRSVPAKGSSYGFGLWKDRPDALLSRMASTGLAVNCQQEKWESGTYHADFHLSGLPQLFGRTLPVAFNAGSFGYHAR